MTIKEYVKKRLVNTLVLLSAIFISLILTEVGVRILAPQPKYYNPKNLFTEDRFLGYVLTPNFNGKMQTPESSTTIKINSDGIRDHERKNINKAAFVILGLGDSFTFGTGVELNQTYLWKLEEMLNNNHGSLYEIVKTGVPGYGTDQEYLFLKNKGLQYKPNLVIIGFYINDVLDSVTPNFTVKDGYLIPGKAAQEYLKHKNINLKQKLSILINKLHTPSFFINRLSTTPCFKKFFLKLVEKAKGKEGNRLKLYSQDYNYKIMKAWTKTQKYLKMIENETKKNGGTVLVVYLPERQQVYDEQWERIVKQYDLKNKKYDVLYPNKILRNFCEKENITFLDLTTSLRKVINKEELYFTMDPHLNAKGHEYAAKLIYRKLMEDIIPKIKKRGINGEIDKLFNYNDFYNHSCILC